MIHLRSCLQLVIVLMYLRICNAQRVTDEVFRIFGQWISAPNPALRKNTIQKDSLSQIAILYPKQIWFKTSCTLKIGLKKTAQGSKHCQSEHFLASGHINGYFRLCCLVAKNFNAFNLDNPYVKVLQVAWGISTKDSAIEDGKGILRESESQFWMDGHGDWKKTLKNGCFRVPGIG